MCLGYQEDQYLHHDLRECCAQSCFAQWLCPPRSSHKGKYILGGAQGRDAPIALNLQMSKLDEATMRELESLCATWVVLRGQRHGDVIEMMSG